MNNKYNPLFTTWKIKDVEIKNRIVMTSMGGTCLFGFMEPNHFDKEAAKLILKVAKNNVGLILPGIAPIKDVMGGKWLYKGKKKFKELTKFMEEFHKTGAKLFVQLTVGFGRVMASTKLFETLATNKFLGTIFKPFLNVDYVTASCSPLPNRWSDKTPSRALTIEEINEIVYSFGQTAKLCKEAGVDGIEVHAVHEGYTLDQFTLNYCNKREDKYGGNFENRYRFSIEILKEIKKECGQNYPVSLRYSIVSKTKGFREGALPNEEFKEVGRDIIEGIKAAQYFEEQGYDMLDCDNGTYDAWYWNHPPMYMPLNCNLNEAEIIKKYVKIPIVVAGRMEVDAAAEAIQNNKIDAMGVARQFLADPLWVTKLINDKKDEIKPCICCHNGCFNLCHYEGVGNDQILKDTLGMCRCAVNAETMQSKKHYIKKAKKPLHIAIVGGGIGGMEVARVAALRGHKVTIYEKSNALGGVFIAASNFDFKEKDKTLINWYRLEMKKLNVHVKYNYNVKDLNEIRADKIVIATGAKAKTLNIKGLDKYIDSVDYLTLKNNIGNDVLVVGGSLTGCEIAYKLFNEGKNPIIVEMKNDLIAVRGVCLANSSYLRDYFKSHFVKIFLNSTIKEVDGNEATIVNSLTKEETKIHFDNIISCIGFDPNPIKSKYPLVGDCYKVGNLKDVIWRAFEVAMKL